MDGILMRSMRGVARRARGRRSRGGGARWDGRCRVCARSRWIGHGRGRGRRASRDGAGRVGGGVGCADACVDGACVARVERRGRRARRRGGGARAGGGRRAIYLAHPYRIKNLSVVGVLFAHRRVIREGAGRAARGCARMCVVTCVNACTYVCFVFVISCRFVTRRRRRCVTASPLSGTRRRSPTR